MKYIINPKIGSITAMFTVSHNDSRPDQCNMVLDLSLERIRGRLSKYMKKVLSKMKPDGDMLSWNTTLGTFVIYRDFEYEDNTKPYASKYKFLYHHVELDRRKNGGEVEDKKYFIKKIINDECKDLEECFSCNAKMVESFKIKQWGDIVNVCKKCKNFDTKLDQIAKKLDKEKAKKNSKVLMI